MVRTQLLSIASTVILSLLGVPVAWAVTADNVNCNKCVGKGDLGNKVVTKKKLMNNAVTKKKLKDNAVSTSKIKDAAITGSKLGTGAVSTSHLADGAVTAAKLDASLLAGLSNVVYVAKSGGNFTDPRAAVNSITDASESNAYLVYIAPGIYDLGSTPLQMKQWVSIRGSGWNLTTLTAEVEGGTTHVTTGVVDAENNVTLSDLTVENSLVGARAAGIYSNGQNHSFVLERVRIEVVGGSIRKFGIVNIDSKPTIRHVVTLAQGGSISNFGVLNSNSSPEMYHVLAQAGGGSVTNMGVSNNSNSSPFMYDVTAVGGGTDSYGVWNESSSTPKILNSIIEGESKGLFMDASSADGTRVANSQITGGVTDPKGATINCFNNFTTDLDPEICNDP